MGCPIRRGILHVNTVEMSDKLVVWFQVQFSFLLVSSNTYSAHPYPNPRYFPASSPTDDNHVSQITLAFPQLAKTD